MTALFRLEPIQIAAFAVSVTLTVLLLFAREARS